MDAISSYQVQANTDGTVSVIMNSEYAAGSIVQHQGYVISGTTADGIYLEVRDVDTAAGADPRYRLDTPDGFSAAGCTIPGSPVASTACPTGPSLPLTHTRIFTAGDNPPGVLLKDPLWYAAKYGGFKECADHTDGVPDRWRMGHTRLPATPDNYFLVTNALGLRAQLQAAFDSIIAASQPVGSAAASGARFVPFGTLAYQATYLATDWTGDLTASPLNSNGSLGAQTWSASAKLPATPGRAQYPRVETHRHAADVFRRRVHGSRHDHGDEVADHDRPRYLRVQHHGRPRVPARRSDEGDEPRSARTLPLTHDEDRRHSRFEPDRAVPHRLRLSEPAGPRERQCDRQRELRRIHRVEVAVASRLCRRERRHAACVRRHVGQHRRRRAVRLRAELGTAQARSPCAAELCAHVFRRWHADDRRYLRRLRLAHAAGRLDRRGRAFGVRSRHHEPDDVQRIERAVGVQRPGRHRHGYFDRHTLAADDLGGRHVESSRSATATTARAIAPSSSSSTR